MRKLTKKYLIAFATVCLSVSCVAGVACANPSGGATGQTQIGTVEMIPKTLALQTGEKYKLETLDCLTLEYTFASSNPEVCTVSAAGFVRAISEGTAEITATRGAYRYVCAVTVKPKELVETTPDYNVSVTALIETAVGAEKQITATVLKNGKESDDIVTWNIPQTDVISVTANGNVLNCVGNKIGTVEIGYTIGNFNGSTKVKVYDETCYLPNVETTVGVDGVSWSMVEGAVGYRYTLTGGASWTEISSETLSVSYDNKVNPVNVAVVAVADKESQKVDSKYTFTDEFVYPLANVKQALSVYDKEIVETDENGATVYALNSSTVGEFGKIYADIYGTDNALLDNAFGNYKNTALVLDVKASVETAVYFTSKSATGKLNFSNFTASEEWISVGFTLDALETLRLEANGDIFVKNIRLAKDNKTYLYSTAYAALYNAVENLDNLTKEEVFKAANSTKYLTERETLALTNEKITALDERYFELYPEYTEECPIGDLTPDMLSLGDGLGSFYYYTTEKDGVKVRLLYGTKMLMSGKFLFEFPETSDDDMIIMEWYNGTPTSAVFLGENKIYDVGWQISSIAAKDFNSKNSFCYSNGYFGVYKVHVVKVGEAAAFEKALTTDMFVQNQELNGEKYTHSPTQAVVKKDGDWVTVIKSRLGGLSMEATESFAALIPETAKDTDNIVVDVYFFGGSACIIANRPASDVCYTGEWHTFKCSVAEWKATPRIYSNSVIGLTNFRVEEVPIPQGFGQDLTTDMFVQKQEYQGEHYVHTTTLDVLEKDGERVSVIKTRMGGLSMEATQDFLNLIPETAKDTDNVLVDVYFYDASACVFSKNPASEICSEGEWYTFKCSVANWKAKPSIYSNGVIGVTNFRIEEVPVPQAFGQELTLEMFKQYQEYQGQEYWHKGALDLVEKDGEKVAVIKFNGGLIVFGQDEFNAIIPATAKDSDYIVFDLYAYSASGWLLAGVTQDGLLQENKWHTAKVSVGAWKETPKIYSNGAIGITNFRIEEVPVPQAFGQELTLEMFKQYQEYQGQEYWHKGALDLVEKDGEKVAVIKFNGGLIVFGQDEFNAIIPATAKDSDYIVFDLYAYSASGWLISGVTQSSNLAANAWHTGKTTVGEWKANPKVYSNGAIGLTNFRIETVPVVNAFGSTIAANSAFSNAKEAQFDGETVVSGGNSVGAKPTAALLALLPATVDGNDEITFKIWCTSRATMVFGDNKGNAWEENQWVEYTTTYAKFISGSTIYSASTWYVKDFTFKAVASVTAFGADMDMTKTYFTNNGAAATFDKVEKDGETVAVIKNSPGFPMLATEDFNALIPATAKDTDYIVIDVYFYTMHLFTMGGVTFNGGTEQYGCYAAGSWQTFKCTVAQWKANSTFYTEASVGVCNFRIETAQ